MHIELGNRKSGSSIGSVDGGVAGTSFWRQVLGSRASQLLLHLAFTLLPPTIFWFGWKPGNFDFLYFQNSILALTVCAAGAWWVMQRLRAYAKARLLSYVFPVNFIIFASVLSAIAVFRLDYSVYLFALGATGGVVSSFLSAALSRRSYRLQFVVPGGRTSEIRLGGNFVPAADITELEALLQARRLDGSIVADLHFDHSPQWERMFARAALAGVPVYHYRQVAEMQQGQVKILHLSENDLGSLIPNVPYMTTKRAIDLLGSLTLLPVLLPVFVIIALLIKLDSPGRVLFLQERMGFRGRPFRIIKFRTMRERKPAEEGDEQRNEAMTKSDDDRITKIGRFLRKTRLDELPQVFNILNGEMSWIGPRPEAIPLSRWYEEELPFYCYRHIVRPGISGWAQVNQGHVTDVTDVNAKLRYDFYYIKNISLWLDLLVLLKTFRVVFTGNGAK